MSGYREDVERAARVGLPWEMLEGRRVLVAGATGLIGGCLVDVLMAHGGIVVVAMGRDWERARERFGEYWGRSEFVFVTQDVTRRLGYVDRVDYVVHCASGASPSAFVGRPVEVVRSNVDGVVNLVEYGMGHGMRRLLYVSSGEVYGDCGGGMIEEGMSGYVDLERVRSCYPTGKRAGEVLCVAYGDEYGVDVVRVRPAHVYGPYYSAGDNRVYAQFIRNVLRGEDIVMKSAGGQVRSWCYVVDCVEGMLWALTKGEKGEAYNVADNREAVSIVGLAEMVAEIGGVGVVRGEASEEESRGYNTVGRSVYVTDKLEGLGWRVEGGMRDKMRSTIEAMRKG